MYNVSKCPLLSVVEIKFTTKKYIKVKYTTVRKTVVPNNFRMVLKIEQSFVLFMLYNVVKHTAGKYTTKKYIKIKYTAVKKVYYDTIVE